MSIDLSGLDLSDPRCPVCIGPAGEDNCRCERDALPLHRTHLIDGIYYFTENTDEINDTLQLAHEIEALGND